MNAYQICLEKQLLINKLLDNRRCFDLRNDIKNYLFVDHIYLDSRNKKNKLIKNFNLFSIRSECEFSGNWVLRYGYEIYFDCINCILCGGFKYITPRLHIKVASRALCSCPGFQEEYSHEIYMLNQPLQIFNDDGTL
jgi:hypothetical protein